MRRLEDEEEAERKLHKGASYTKGFGSPPNKYILCEVMGNEPRKSKSAKMTKFQGGTLGKLKLVRRQKYK